jgi:hypothetical protein
MYGRIPFVVVARSPLRAITFASNSAAPRFTLTSIAPTHAAVASVAKSPLRAITFASNSAALRFTLTSIAPTPLDVLIHILNRRTVAKSSRNTNPLET